MLNLTNVSRAMIDRWFGVNSWLLRSPSRMWFGGPSSSTYGRFSYAGYVPPSG